MSKDIQIRTADKHTIHGTLTTSKKRSSTLLVFVHGFSGFRNEHIFFNAAKFFPQKGFDVFRFDLYSGEKGGRLLSDCSISTHVSDTNTVVNHFKKSYKKIFLIGHSLGGLSILLADQKHIHGIILWDASRQHSEADLQKEFHYNPALKKYIASWGFEVLVGEKMIKEWSRLPQPKQLAKTISVPISVICTGKGILVKAAKEYYTYATTPKTFTRIKDATHNFDEDGAEEQLFKETLSFVRKF